MMGKERIGLEYSTIPVSQAEILGTALGSRPSTRIFLIRGVDVGQWKQVNKLVQWGTIVCTSGTGRTVADLGPWR